MAFDIIRLPVDIEQGSQFGPAFSTEVLQLSSGKEKRNQNRVRQLCAGDVGYGIMDKDDYIVVRTFFYGRRGRARGFLFKDWSDFQSNGIIVLGVGNGSIKDFLLFNVYDDGVNAYTRPITRPVVDSTFLLLNNSVPVTSGFTVDTLGVHFVTAPLNTHVIAASFEFDVPVRFDTDDFLITMDQIEAGQVGKLPIVELLE